MGVAYIHFHSAPQEVLHCNSNGQLTISCHIFYSVYHKDSRIILVVVMTSSKNTPNSP